LAVIIDDIVVLEVVAVERNRRHAAHCNCTFGSFLQELGVIRINGYCFVALKRIEGAQADVAGRQPVFIVLDLI